MALVYIRGALQAIMTNGFPDGLTGMELSADVLPYFKRWKAHESGDSHVPWREAGPLRVFGESRCPGPILTGAFVQAANRRGFKLHR